MYKSEYGKSPRAHLASERVISLPIHMRLTRRTSDLHRKELERDRGKSFKINGLKPTMNLSGKKVLLTGAGGFIGSHLCEALVKSGAEVTAMIHYNSRNDLGEFELVDSDVRSNIKVTAGNIEDSDFVARQVKGKEIVFHLAALIAIPYSYSAPLSYIRTNVEGTLNVMEACREYEVQRVVHTSTSETYGTAIYTPIDEKHPL